MKLDQLTKIKQTPNENIVNEYLAKGYKIIKIFSGKTTIDNQEFVQPIYVLGLVREGWI